MINNRIETCFNLNFHQTDTESERELEQQGSTVTVSDQEILDG